MDTPQDSINNAKTIFLILFRQGHNILTLQVAAILAKIAQRAVPAVLTGPDLAALWPVSKCLRNTPTMPELFPACPWGIDHWLLLLRQVFFVIDRLHLQNAVNFMADQRLVRAHFHGEVAKRTSAKLFVLFVKLTILLIDQFKKTRNSLQRRSF